MQRLRHWVSGCHPRRRYGATGTRGRRGRYRSGKVAKLAGGDIPFYEPGLRKLLTDNLAAGRLRFTTDYDMAADFADVHFLGVGTRKR